MHHIDAVYGVANSLGSPKSNSEKGVSYAPFGPMKFELTYQATGRVEKWLLIRFLGGDRFLPFQWKSWLLAKMIKFIFEPTAESVYDMIKYVGIQTVLPEHLADPFLKS